MYMPHYLWFLLNLSDKYPDFLFFFLRKNLIFTQIFYPFAHKCGCVSCCRKPEFTLVMMYGQYSEIESEERAGEKEQTRC